MTMGWFSGAPPIPKPPEGDPKPGPPPIGDVNILEAAVGQRGTGKSTLLAERAYDLSILYRGAYVLGHSLGARLPRKLPDGTELPLEYHQTLKKLEQGLRRHPSKWHILAPPQSMADSDRDTADDLLRFTVRLSEQIRRDAWRRANPVSLKSWNSNTPMDGIPATPIIVVIDEGIAIEAAGPAKKEANRWFFEFLFSIRHYHIALLYSIQDPTARSWQVLNQATDIHVFNMRHRYAIEAIRAAGATDDEMTAIAALPTPRQLKEGKRKHEHVSLKLEGVVEPPDWAKEP